MCMLGKTVMLPIHFFCPIPLSLLKWKPSSMDCTLSWDRTAV